MKVSKINIEWANDLKVYEGTVWINEEGLISKSPAISIKLDENEVKLALEVLAPSISNRVQNMCTGVTIEGILGIQPVDDLPF